MNEKWVIEKITNLEEEVDIPPASATVRGTVKIGNGISVTTDGTISSTGTTLVHTVVTTAGTGSTITLDHIAVLQGGSITATIALSDSRHYSLDDVKVDGVSVGVVSSYTFSNMTADHTIETVTTAKTKYYITVTQPSHGSITLGSPYTTYAVAGEDIPVTISADSGYYVSDVQVDGVSVGELTSYTFEDISADHTVTATISLPTIYSFTIGTGSTPADITYGDSAAGLTEAQRQAVVRSIAKHAVVNNGAIAYWLNPDNLAQKADGTAADLTGTDGDVMLMFSPVWWNTESTASGLKISFSIKKFSDDAVTAHWWGDSNGVIVASYVGLGVFEGIIQSSTLRSINSSSTPTVSTTEPAFYTAATYGRSARYNVELPMTRALWAILLLFEHGTRDLQTKIGYGRVNTSSAGAVNANWDATNPWNRGNTGSSTNEGVTAGGIHNPWGNVWEFLGEFIYRDGTSYFSILGGSDHYTITSGYSGRPSTWHSCAGGAFTTDSYIKEVAGDAYMPFIPKTTGGSSATYYCDNAWQAANQDSCCSVGARWSDAAAAGAFAWFVSNTAGFSYANIGARLQVLVE